MSSTNNRIMKIPPSLLFLYIKYYITFSNEIQSKKILKTAFRFVCVSLPLEIRHTRPVRQGKRKRKDGTTFTPDAFTAFWTLNSRATSTREKKKKNFSAPGNIKNAASFSSLLSDFPFLFLNGSQWKSRGPCHWLDDYTRIATPNDLFEYCPWRSKMSPQKKKKKRN